MAYLKALGLGITVNIHDASGVNDWEDEFPALAARLGLPAGATKVPFNLVNSTVTCVPARPPRASRAPAHPPPAATLPRARPSRPAGTPSRT